MREHESIESIAERIGRTADEVFTIAAELRCRVVRDAMGVEHLRMSDVERVAERISGRRPSRWDRPTRLNPRGGENWPKRG